MKVLTAAEMRACDERTVEQFGVSWQQLMENAGAAVADFALLQFPHAERITVLCGKGNNGGDGLVAARHLEAAGKQVRIVLLAPPEHLESGPRSAYDKLPQALKKSALTAVTGEDLEEPAFARHFDDAELLIDAIFGTGFRPPLRGVAAALRARVATHSAPVLSVDLPTGWDADATAMHAEEAFHSDAVITFTAPKLAHVFAAITGGPVVVAQIGSPPAAILSGGNPSAADGISRELLWAGASKKIVEGPRALNSNKGRFGHVLILGGSVGKAGAPSMSSLGAMRAGAGLTTAAVPRSIAGIVAGYAPEMMLHPLEETSAGQVATENLDPARLKALLQGITVLAIGPGMGRAPETAEFVRGLLEQAAIPTVLDADGLNALDGHAELLDGRKRPLVLTPHPGEMARLLGCTIADVEQDRVHIAREFAVRHHVTLVLKGWRTLVAHPDGVIAVNTSGNPALAKGGSGDVLTGMVAALVAQFPSNLRQAVECAVWLHGAAADRFVRTRDERTMLATELLDHLSAAILEPVDHDGFTWLQEARR